MVDPYVEAPLNLREREIRLVTLEHSHVSEPIKCILRSYALDDECAAYVALSYAWGAKERYDYIQINDFSFPVGRSLWSFLHQMRMQHQHSTFWIDAVCINQADVFEQNHQVQMMRQIYTNAHSVWVWLGEADDTTHSDVAMQYMKTREAFGNREVNYKKLWNASKARAVLSLCERVYWRRIWIVQEIMLAKDATVLCGNHRVGFTELQHLISDLQTISDRGRAMHITGVSDVLDSPATTIVKAKSEWDGSPQPLTTLLEQYHNQQSTDVRDKVYALHGLAHNSDAIAINYHIEPKALLTEIIYHTCSQQASKTDMKRSKKDLLRFAKMMRETLKVICTDEELDFHISVARGDGISMEKDYGLRIRGQFVEEGALRADSALEEYINGHVPSWHPSWSQHVPTRNQGPDDAYENRSPPVVVIPARHRRERIEGLYVVRESEDMVDFRRRSRDPERRRSLYSDSEDMARFRRHNRDRESENMADSSMHRGTPNVDYLTGPSIRSIEDYNTPSYEPVTLLMPTSEEFDQQQQQPQIDADVHATQAVFQDILPKTQASSLANQQVSSHSSDDPTMTSSNSAAINVAGQLDNDTGPWTLYTGQHFPDVFASESETPTSLEDYDPETYLAKFNPFHQEDVGMIRIVADEVHADDTCGQTSPWFHDRAQQGD
ncbi:HET-domain-containing protein [Ophiobolus disseminans]|uniref:HET-domain-containing protein n=1 Tax=Ophiobolus disseminans TaxID=1469910 RepID=A0A6A7A606_9PLEO|nr:HET-domain-containing protein [Ophiobolus disseminans]